MSEKKTYWLVWSLNWSNNQWWTKSVIPEDSRRQEMNVWTSWQAKQPSLTIRCTLTHKHSWVWWLHTWVTCKTTNLHHRTLFKWSKTLALRGVLALNVCCVARTDAVQINFCATQSVYLHWNGAWGGELSRCGPARAAVTLTATSSNLK